MEQAQFEAMVARLEIESRAAPGAYQARVALLALLGFGLMAAIVGLAGLGLLLAVGLVVAVVLTGGKALILVLKLGKLLVLMLVPLWVLLRTSVTALFTRLPRPQGLPIVRGDAPALFEAMDRMRSRMRGPRFHHVLVTDEMNAAVVQRPLLGLAGWPRNHLILGLPLLESLAPDEALAVVAHEYGHLSGSHGHFGAFIYRLRHTWATLQQLAHQWQGLGGHTLRRLVDWYAPYFNAYTFVLARANEYQADAASAELVSAAVAASALKRVNVAGAWYNAFIEQAFEAIRTQAQPPADLAARWARLAVQSPDAAQAGDWLQRALDRHADPMDTHPALRQRLAALPGQAPDLQVLPGPVSGPSAAEAWFGASVDTLRHRLQTQWVAQVSGPWADKHRDWQERRKRLDDLLALPQPTADEQAEVLHLRRQFDPQADHVPALAAFNAAHARHAQGLFLEGCARLDRGDEAGLAMLEQAIAVDADATRPACERAHAYLHERNDTRAQAWAERWAARQAWEQERLRQMRQLDTAHELREHGLSAEELLQVQRCLASAGAGIACAWLARRVLPADAQVRTFVLAVQFTAWVRWRSQEGERIAKLAECEWPVHVILCAVRADNQDLLPRLRALGRSEIARA